MGKVSSLQVRASKVGTLQVCPRKIGIPQVDVCQMNCRHYNTSEVSTLEEGFMQIRARKIHLGTRGLDEIRPEKMGAPQVDPSEFCLSKICTSKVGSQQVDIG
jgi:hypothetical protein